MGVGVSQRQAHHPKAHPSQMGDNLRSCTPGALCTILTVYATLGKEKSCETGKFRGSPGLLNCLLPRS